MYIRSREAFRPIARKRKYLMDYNSQYILKKSYSSLFSRCLQYPHVRVGHGVFRHTTPKHRGNSGVGWICYFHHGFARICIRHQGLADTHHGYWSPWVSARGWLVVSNKSRHVYDTWTGKISERIGVMHVTLPTSPTPLPPAVGREDKRTNNRTMLPSLKK